MKLQIVLASLTILVIGCSPKKQNEPINIEPLEDDFDSSELFAGYANNQKEEKK